MQCFPEGKNISDLQQFYLQDVVGVDAGVRPLPPALPRQRAHMLTCLCRLDAGQLRLDVRSLYGDWRQAGFVLD